MEASGQPCLGQRETKITINEVILINDQIIDTIFVHSAYPIWDLAVDTNNVLWIATQDSGLTKYTGSELNLY